MLLTHIYSHSPESLEFYSSSYNQQTSHDVFLVSLISSCAPTQPDMALVCITKRLPELQTWTFFSRTPCAWSLLGGFTSANLNLPEYIRYKARCRHHTSVPSHVVRPGHRSRMRETLFCPSGSSMRSCFGSVPLPSIRVSCTGALPVASTGLGFAELADGNRAGQQRRTLGRMAAMCPRQRRLYVAS